MKRIGLLILATLLLGCAELTQTGSHFVSSMVGLKRSIILYSANGTIIQQWEGTFQVEIDGGTARFLDGGKAVTISGTYTIIEE